MGYRMSILCPGYNEIELGKFYGYVKLDGLESVKYLLNKQLIKDADIFNWSQFGPDFTLSAEEFRDFMDLYQKDINNYDFSQQCICYDKPYSISDHFIFFKDIYYNDDRKYIYWG